MLKISYIRNVIYLNPSLIVLFFVVSILMGCSEKHDEAEVVKVAFIADVHFHDIFANVRAQFDHAVLPIISGDSTVFARTMAAQLGSTRLFNENYFAFKAALDDITTRNIRYVVLNGDFSDDGQPVNVEKIVEMLRYYENQYGIRFFMSFGNHDPYLPYTIPAGKADFLLADGLSGGIYSPGHPQCEDGNMLCLEGLEELGYQDLLTLTSEFGFLPRAGDYHFETPFSYQENFNPLDFTQREYSICTEDDSWCGVTFDTSYLIEPEPGIWLLSIDANVHLPRNQRQNDDVTDPRNYFGSGNAGFNAVIDYKPFLIDWMKDVSQRAKQQQKQLFVFSHYPAGDFYHDSREELIHFFGENRFQLRRLPTERTQKTIAETGIPFHVGGHMHVNNTHAIRDSTGTIRTWGIQSPSLAAFSPGYTIIHYSATEEIHVQTILLRDVPEFRRLFDLYNLEWQNLRADQWSVNILEIDTYFDYTIAHLKQLIDRRFIPEDWPEPLANHLPNDSLESMLTYLNKTTPPSCSKNLSLLEMVQHFYFYRNGGTVANELISSNYLSCYSDLAVLLRNDQSNDFDSPLESQFIQFVNLLNRFSKPLPDVNFVIQTDVIRSK